MKFITLHYSNKSIWHLPHHTMKITTPHYTFDQKKKKLSIFRKLQDSCSSYAWLHICSRFICSITGTWVIERAKSKSQVKFFVLLIASNLVYELWIFNVFLNSPHHCACFHTLQVWFILTCSMCNKKLVVHRYLMR